MAEEKAVKYDIDGYAVITTALSDLINQFPGLRENEEILFSTLGEDNGISMFPVSGSVVETEIEDITGHVSQVCLYPFYVVCRAGGLSESRKLKIKEWLDNLGRWLEKQTVIIGNTEYTLESYPELTGERQFLDITRQSPSYLGGENENKSEDWVIDISARYRNEFDR